jgi:hypothetical protein
MLGEFLGHCCCTLLHVLIMLSRAASQAKLLTDEQDEQVPNEDILAALDKYNKHGKLPDQVVGAYVE